MLINYKPYILSVERGIDQVVDPIGHSKINLNNTNQFWFEIFDHKFNRYSLEEAKPFLELKVAHIHKVPNPQTGEYVKEKKYFDMETCKAH